MVTSRRSPWCWIVALVVALSLVSTVGAIPDTPYLSVIYPNTVHPGNAGEYIAITFPEPTNTTGWTLTAGTTTAALPNTTLEGTVAFSTEPTLTAKLADDPVVELTDYFTISQAGGVVTLADGHRIIDERAYPPTSTGHLYANHDGDWDHRIRGSTSFEPERVPVESVITYSFPDAAGKPVDRIETATDRIKLAGYTFESDATAAAVLAAHRRGVAVTVLVDGSPVGGQTRAETEQLDRLAAAGIDVRVFDGPSVRYRFHHAKYAIVDDTVAVYTENWKPAGIGGRSSRGWGVTVSNPIVADAVAAIFNADIGWEDTTDWTEVRQHRPTVPSDPATGEYPVHFQPEPVAAEAVTIVTAPDNAEAVVLDLVATADDSIDVQQVSISDLSFPFLVATLEAADRGVRVRLLLDHSWYVDRENRRIAREIAAYAEQRDAPIEVRIVEPRSRFGKIHTKGVIVDGQQVLIGSINWNNNSVRNNRELALVIDSEPAAAYYTAVFEADWAGARWMVPVEFVGLVATAGAGAGMIGLRWIRFRPADR